jgi:RecB family exonuclease
MNNPFAGPDAVPEWPKQKAWSYSAASNHAKCPRKFRYQRIDKLPEPENEAMARGSLIHKACEARIKHGVDQSLVAAPWLERLDELRSRGAIPEVQLAFDKQWQSVPWFGAHVWGRCVLDASYKIAPAIVQIVEFKTGKVYPEHTQQLRLYALAGFILHPEAEEVRSELWYLDKTEAPRPGYVAQRSAVPHLKEEFIEFSRPMLNDTIYPARPGPLCRWCHFRKANNGPCEF